jgi:aspartyl-tRNA(Asn)/glutamyl-tRNA(Gln) amidotransferase subunit B
MHLKGARIGLEIHVQLNTKRKLFCFCSTKAIKPNTQVCEVCLGMPGAKPMLNHRALMFAIGLAVALKSGVNEVSRFDRKTYFYPDLPKNYQITQYHYPLSQGGYLELNNKKIRITRIQLEEDPGAITYTQHIDVSKYSLIDYNRSGIPLCEVVTEPDFSSAKEVKQFLKKFVSIIKHLKIYSSDMSLRVDTNVSIGKNPRVEIKNIGSIKDVVSAIDHEIFRQTQLIQKKEKIKQETRRFTGSSTQLMREKETEEDYGYVIDPDLPPIMPVRWLPDIFKSMPELPDQRVQRMMKQYKLNKHQALAIVSEKELADFFEAVAKKVNPKLVASWTAGQLLKVLNYNNLFFSETKLKPQQFISFLELLQAGEVSDRAGDLLLRELVLTPQNPKQLAKTLNLLNMSDSEVAVLVKKIVAIEKKAVVQYKQGDKKVLSYLVGQVVRASKGRADAKKLKKEIIKNL